MAAVMLHAGTQTYESPFPNDQWLLVFKWELQGGAWIFLQRNGDEFRYKILGDGDDIIGDLLYEGDPEEFFNLIIKMRPFRVGDQLKFVNHESHSSDMDKTKTVTKDVWALTLVSQLSRGNNTYGITNMLGGHAYILIERINEFGILEKLKAHIFIQNSSNMDIPIGYAKPGIHEDNYDAQWPKTDTYIRSAIQVQNMIQDVLEQRKQYQNSLDQGINPPIRFNARSPIPEEGIHNCLTWCLSALKIVDITIPLIKFPLPGRSPWYIPRYHIRSITQICKQLGKEDIDMTPYVAQDVLQEIRADEKLIGDKKELLRFMSAYIPAIFVVPPMQILIPSALLFGIPFSIVEGVKTRKMEKALARKKALHLENYFNEQIICTYNS